LQNRYEQFIHPVVKLGSQLFTVRRDYGLWAEGDDGRKFRYRKQPQQVVDEGRIIPPAHGLTRRDLTVRRPVRDRRVRNRQVGLSGKLQKGRIERQNAVAYCRGALGKDDDSLAVAQ